MVRTGGVGAGSQLRGGGDCARVSLMWRCCVDRKEVYRQLRSIYPSLACRQFMEGLQQLEKECGYGEERIPQLREISAFLRGDDTVENTQQRGRNGSRTDRVGDWEKSGSSGSVTTEHCLICDLLNVFDRIRF